MSSTERPINKNENVPFIRTSPPLKHISLLPSLPPLLKHYSIWYSCRVLPVYYMMASLSLCPDLEGMVSRGLPNRWLLCNASRLLNSHEQQLCARAALACVARSAFGLSCLKPGRARVALHRADTCLPSGAHVSNLNNRGCPLDG